MLRLPHALRLFCAAGAMLAAALPLHGQQPARATPPPVISPRNPHIQANYGRLPLSFEPSQDGSSFLARGSGYAVQLSQDGARLSLGKDDVLTMQLVGANHPSPAPRDLLPGIVNYFIGKDPSRWRTKIPTYARVSYAGVYPGVDLVYYGNRQALEYDLVIAPRASVAPVRLKFSGANLSLEANGDLKIEGSHGTIAFHQPVAYQMQGETKQPVDAHFVKLSDTEIGFAVGRHDRNRPLVIDPQIAYSTYFNNGEIAAIAADSAGSAYITGNSVGGLPLTPGAFDTTNHQPAPPGVESPGALYSFVTKLSPDGESLVYSTYLGTDALAYAIAVDSGGNAYVAGLTGSQDDFPTTSGAYQSQIHNNFESAFLTKLNPSGSGLVYSTYLGGTTDKEDWATALAVDANGQAYVTGTASSLDFPVTPGAYQTTNHAANFATSNIFVTKFNADGSGLIYSTFVGGSGLRAEGYTTGPPSTNFATDKATGMTVSGPVMYIDVYQGDMGVGIALDSAGNAYVLGMAASLDYPTTPGAFQPTNPTALPSRLGPALAPVVTKLNPTGTALVYSTYLSGSGTLVPEVDPLGNPFTAEYSDSLLAIAVDAAGDAYVVGSSGSSDYPLTAGAFQTTNQQIGMNGSPEYFTSVMSELNPAGTGLIYSTYLGGSSSKAGYFFHENAAGVAVDSIGDAFITGSTGAPDFPVTSDAFEPTLRGVPDPFLQLLGNQSNAYFTEINTRSSQLLYSTYLGGSIGDSAVGISYSAPDSVFITGNTFSPDFPVTPNAFQTSLQVTPPRFTGQVYVYGSAGFVTRIGVNQSGKILTRSVLTTSPASGNQTTLLATIIPLRTSTVEPALAGTVTFSNNGYVIGTSLPAGSPVATASLTTALGDGPTSLSCSYSGDMYYAASNCALQPDFAIALVNPTMTVQSGGNVTATATLNSIGGFTDTIGVACTNVPLHITCKVTPKATILLAFNSTPVSVYVDTAPPLSAEFRSHAAWPGEFALLLLPGVLLNRRRLRLGIALCCALLLPFALTGLNGCGEDIVPYKLPAGTYIIPITGTAQTSGIAHTTQLTLVVTP